MDSHSWGQKPGLPRLSYYFPANARALWSLVPFHDRQGPPSPGQLELPPGAHREATADLTKEMVSGRGHPVGEKRLWTHLLCGPGLAGEGLWASSNTFNLERIKKGSGWTPQLLPLTSYHSSTYFSEYQKLRGNLETPF